MTAARPHPLFDVLTPGLLFHQYRLLEQIGVGGQGVVWSALHEGENRIYAIKFNEVPESDEGEADNMRDERQLESLVKLHHTHILPILEYGFDEQMLFTVSPYIPGGTLTQKIRTAPLSIDEIVRYGTEIATALDYLHTQGIIHRDLKSANILMDLAHNCYLADFGLARSISDSTLAFHTGHGTPPYSPPEQIQMKPITPKSDVYSFGILLYEMFTGQLPWNGKRQLSMEQLNSDQELPDPREFNENLPPVLTNILRSTTSADSASRPSSVGEIMQALQRIFKTRPESLISPKIHNTWVVHDGDAEVLLKSAFAQWKAMDDTYKMGLTRLALVDLDREKINMDTYSHFMLSQALTYGYNDDRWWPAVRDPRERIEVSLKLLRKHNEVIAGHVIRHLMDDPDIRALPVGLPESMISAFLEIGINTDNIFLRQQIFEGLQTLTQPKSVWNDLPLHKDHLQRLGMFALEDTEYGDKAAELIGHFRFVSAVRTVLEHSDEERKITALFFIQKVAGGLPAAVQGNVRFRLSAEWIVRRLIQEPVNLIGAYVLAFLGSALGVGLQVYLTYNLPNMIDMLRITTSLEQGVIVGSVFGLGIFVSRVVVGRFQASKALFRIIIGTIMGTVVMNIAWLIFHVLFLNTPPHGLLITAACAFMAFTFAVGEVFRSRLLRMVLGTVSIFTAILGTWWLHTSFAASPLDLTPVFRYDYSWTMTHVSLTALGVALLIGIFGNLVNLSVVEER